ncbi:hypothetical protein EBT16_10585 [bacterium]|nr:hypothetical protein [bacterium]
MKLGKTAPLVIGFLMVSSLSLGCSFCSSKPKGLTSEGPAQDPGSNTVSTSAGGGVLPPGQSMGTRGSTNGAFSYDLKNYKADGQRSTNEKWSSGDFFDNR